LQSKVQVFADEEVETSAKLEAAIKQQEEVRKKAAEQGVKDIDSLRLSAQKLRQAEREVIGSKRFALAIEYSKAALEVDGLTGKLNAARNAQVQFAEAAAELQIKLPGEEPGRRVGDPESLKASEAAAKEAEKKKRQIDRIFNDALGQIAALDQVTKQFGGSTLATLEKQAKIARKALQDIYAKGVSEDDPRARKLAESLGAISARIRDISPLAQIASVDFAKFAKESDKEAGKLVKRIEEIAEKSKALKEPGLELKTLSAVFSQAAQSGRDFQDVFDAAFSENRANQISKQTEQIGSFFDKLTKQAAALSKEVTEEREATGLKQIESALKGLEDAIGPLQSGIESFISTAFEGGANAFSSFTKSFGENIKKLIARLVAAAAAAAALGFIISAVFPALGLGNLAGGLTKTLTGGGQTSLIAGLLKRLGVNFFAEGGIVSRPVLGIVGEAGPEAIIPLDRLKEFQGQGGELTGEVRLRGTDLAIILQRAENQRRRSRGT
jgi:hypothetical protein